LKRLSFLFAIALVSCSSGGSSTNPIPNPMAPVPSGGATANAAPSAVTCPAIGKTYKSANASSTFEKEVTFPVFHTILSWQVTFSHQATTTAPVRYVPALATCGAAFGQKPFGEVRNLGITSLKSTCTNGVCSVTVSYAVEYTPKKNLPGHKAWRFDVVRFYPSPATKPFGMLPAYRIEIKKLLP
jgi:hypothetical protein